MIAPATPAPAAPSGFQRFLGGLALLMRFQRGTACYEVDANGDFVPAGVVVTVRMERGEGLEAFHHRIRRDYGLRPGDRIEILNTDGRCDTARLTMQPR